MNEKLCKAKHKKTGGKCPYKAVFKRYCLKHWINNKYKDKKRTKLK